MNKERMVDLAWGLGILVLALGVSYARELGYIDRDSVTRIVMAPMGLMIAWFANRMPKRFLPSASARRAAHVGGWAMVISGLVHAGLWMFAPIPLAIAGGSSAMLAGIAVTLGYCLSQRAKAGASHT